MVDDLDENERSERMAMQPRKKQVKAPQTLPTDFIKSIGKLFNSQFQKQKKAASFSIYGSLYTNEALLCISLMEVGRLKAVSFYASVDLGKNIALKPEQVTEILKSMVDLGASWFGQSFSEHTEGGLDAILVAMADIAPTWQKVAWEKRDVYVLINHDNQILEQATDRFLKEGK